MESFLEKGCGTDSSSVEAQTHAGGGNERREKIEIIPYTVYGNVHCHMGVTCDILLRLRGFEVPNAPKVRGFEANFGRFGRSYPKAASRGLMDRRRYP